MNHYHAYRLFPRLTEFNTLFRGQRLFQQYLVDAAATIDQYAADVWKCLR